jgi:hypothetical protein
VPLRLLGLGAAVHGLVLVVLALAGLPPGSGPALQFALVYGVGGLVLLGALLTYLPRWLQTASVHYGWYGGANLLGLAGLALLEVGLYQGHAWLAGGALLLLAGWLVATRALWWVYHFARPARRAVAWPLLLALSLGGLGIGLFLVGLAFDHAGWMAVSPAVGLFTAALPVGPSATVVRRTAPAVGPSGGYCSPGSCP